MRSKGVLRGSGSWLGVKHIWWWAGGALAVIAVAGIAVAAIFGGGSAKPVRVDFAQLPGLQTGPPPWNNGVGELQDNLATLHLDPLAQEALAFHVHDHLDVYVNGKHVQVPQGIGISSFITELHTHAVDGVIHVESARSRPYTLGQLFGEWAVRLNARCLGTYCGQLHWWVDGRTQSGNPALLNLVKPAQREIVLAAGRPPSKVPVSYNFPAGE